MVYTHDPEANMPGLVGTMVKGLKRSVAHEHSLKLSQTVRRGMQDHARRGGWTGGRPPFGYRRALVNADGSITVLSRRKAKGEKSTLVMDQSEASIVLDIYDAYAHRGRGIATIANSLNARGVPPPASYRRIGPATWTKATLWALLRSPVYVGTLATSKARYSEIGRKRGKIRRPAAEHIIVEGAVPAIVPRPLWDTAAASEAAGRGNPPASCRP